MKGKFVRYDESTGTVFIKADAESEGAGDDGSSYASFDQDYLQGIV